MSYAKTPLVTLMVLPCLLVVAVAMASAITFDPNISNGTCWYSNDEQADSIYIPCGNSAIDPQPCCQARDVCLSSNACYNGQYGVTYLAGCTDPTYQNSTVCPQKGEWISQQWVGLVRCFVSNDTNSQDEQWAPCQDRNQPTVGTGAPCSCNTASSTAVFTDSPALTNIASLPVKAGNDIAWFPGFSPATPTGTSFSTSSGTSWPFTLSVITLTSSTPTLVPGTTPMVTGQTQNISSPQPSSTTTIPTLGAASGNSALTTTDKVGIGIGSAAGASIIAGIVAWCILRCRKSRKSRKATPPIPAIQQIRPRSVIETYPEEEANGQVDDQDLRSPAWSGHNSELPANDSTPLRVMSSPNQTTSARPLPHDSIPTVTPSYRAYSQQIRPVSEVEGNSVVGTSSDKPLPRPPSTTPAYQKMIYEMPG